jgi:hypothetical protein
MTPFFSIFKKKFFFKLFYCQKNYFKKFSRIFRKVKNPSVLRKNFFVPNYNTGYNLLKNSTLSSSILRRRSVYNFSSVARYIASSSYNSSIANSRYSI